MHVRSDASFNNLLCDGLQPIAVGLMVAVENREVEPVSSVDLDVQVSRAEAWSAKKLR